jgi:hypothetical protein
MRARYLADVANAVQVELCKHLTGLSSFLWDSVELPPLFPCPLADPYEYDRDLVVVVFEVDDACELDTWLG